MKRFKKFMVCLLALAIFAGSQVAYVSAAENEIMTLSAFAYQNAESGDAKVQFVFEYSDGNSAKLAAVWNLSSDIYDMQGAPSTSFSGDKCTASIVLVHKTTGATVTLRAWCNIYGETSSY